MDHIACGLVRLSNPQISGRINGVYITSNEKNVGQTQEVLKTYPIPNAHTAHIGCATWYNLDVITLRKSHYGVFFDFNPASDDFMKRTLHLIHTCETREAFKNAMIRYLRSLMGEERDAFFHRDQRGEPIDRIEQELSRPESWLGSDENYRYIKGLVSNGRLVSIVENITNTGVFSEIRALFNRNNVVIDTVYTSNIEDFMRTPEDKRLFLNTMNMLIDADTIFIHAPSLTQVVDIQRRNV